MSYQSRLMVLVLADALIIGSSVLLSYMVRFEFQHVQYMMIMPYVALVQIAFVVTALYLVRLYRPFFRFVGMRELVAVCKAVTLAELCVYLFEKVVRLIISSFFVPFSIYILSWAFIFLGIGGFRFIGRLASHPLAKRRPNQRRTLIVGAGSAGLLVAKVLLQTENAKQFPVAFIDDDDKKQNMQILGLPVVGNRGDITRVVTELSVEDIVIAIPSAPRKDISEIIEICNKSNAKVKILPSVTDLISGHIMVEQIRNVKIEDLLCREPVQISLQEVSSYLMNEIIMVTGAGGSIGSEICRQVASFKPKELVLLGHGENSIYEISTELKSRYPSITIHSVIADIQDRNRIREVFERKRPTTVFHAAAHKHVPLMEENPVEAIKNNVLGTRNVVEFSHEYGVERFVLISTDKAVNPTSVMGATKRVAEMIIQGMSLRSRTKFVAVRFGNVLGSRGSVIPLFLNQIKQGGPVTVTHPEMVRYFMTIPEAVQLVLQAASLANGGEIYVLDMGKPVKVVDLAKNLIKMAGFEPEVDIKVAYTGIRQGEKLFEEILTDEEGATCTKHERIFMGKQSLVAWGELQLALSSLESLVYDKEADRLHVELRETIKSIVPSYHFYSVHEHVFKAAGKGG